MMDINGKLSSEKLQDLIEQVSMARTERETLFLTSSEWKSQLSLHPKDFTIYDDELLYLGCKVGVVGSEQERTEFASKVNQLANDGYIRGRRADQNYL